MKKVLCFLGVHEKEMYWLIWNEKDFDGKYFICTKCGKILKKEG